MASANEGKAAVLDALGGPGEGNPDSTHSVENIFVGDDLAVIREAKGSIPHDTDEPIGGGLKALDVSRRGDDGEWFQQSLSCGFSHEAGRPEISQPHPGS